MDVLRAEYGIAPVGMLGHSAGEIACGYACGILTRSQTALVAYLRGQAAPKAGVSGGLMASVGLNVEEAEAQLLAAGLERTVVACDNSSTNVTLSGGQASTTSQASHLIRFLNLQTYLRQEDKHSQ